jgi:hypothetical protein
MLRRSPPPRRSCAGTGRDGQPCRATPRTDSDLCLHCAARLDPELAARLQEARRRGGQARWSGVPSLAEVRAPARRAGPLSEAEAPPAPSGDGDALARPAGPAGEPPDLAAAPSPPPPPPPSAPRAVAAPPPRRPPPPPRPPLGDWAALATLRDVRRGYAAVLQGLLAGDYDARVANAAAALLGGAVRAIEADGLAGEVERLRAVVAQQEARVLAVVAGAEDGAAGGRRAA